MLSTIIKRTDFLDLHPEAGHRERRPELHDPYGIYLAKARLGAFPIVLLQSEELSAVLGSPFAPGSHRHHLQAINLESQHAFSPREQA